MRIIDKSGRLFGKINIIDFMIIAVLVSFAGGVISYGMKVRIAKTESPPTDYKKLYEAKCGELETLKAKYEQVFKEHKRMRKYFQ